MKATCTSLKYQHILRLVMAGTLSASFAAAATPSASLVLTQQQQQWVAQRAEKPIRYCFNPHWPPFDFQEGGQHRGIFKDYLDLLFQRVGLQGQAILLPSWSAALDAARRGECEIIAGAVRTTERETFLAFTSPYFNMYNVLIAKPDKPFVGSLSSLEGKTISGPISGAVMQWIARDYPNISQNLVHTGAETLALLLGGKVYAVVSPLASFVSDYEWQVHNLKIIGKLDYDYPISVAVRRDQPDLLSLMELAIQSVTEAERTAIAAKWQRFTVVEEVNYTKLLKLGGAVLVVLGVSWFWIVRLQREIARRRKAEAQLLHLASHDPLTDLLRPNSAMAHITLALERSRRSQHTGALLFIDLDGFKAVNDTLGHSAGDQLLVSVAAKMRTALRKSDMLARMGGDEFLVLLEEIEGSEAAIRVAEKLLLAISEPVTIEMQLAKVGASIGVAMFTAPSASAAALIKAADIAMYESKKQGKGRVTVI